MNMNFKNTKGKAVFSDGTSTYFEATEAAVCVVAI